jgi:hypothetical protein
MKHLKSQMWLFSQQSSKPEIEDEKQLAPRMYLHLLQCHDYVKRHSARSAPFPSSLDPSTI